jgi:hypothetical protein
MERTQISSWHSIFDTAGASSQRISCPAIVDVGEKIQPLQMLTDDGHQQAAIIPTNLVPLQIRGCFPSRRTLLLTYMK